MPKYPIWHTTAERYVAYINIIGLKTFTDEANHQELINSMAELRDMLADIDQITTFLDQPAKDKDRRSALVKTALLADTVLLVSRDMGDDAVGHFIGSAMRIQMYLLQNGIAVRGGMASGLFTFDPDNLLFSGQPLSDAIALSKVILFFGIAERAANQSANAVEDLRRIPEEYVPLQYPCLERTFNGPTVLMVINIAIVANQIDDIRGIHQKLLNHPNQYMSGWCYKNTVTLFEKAYAFTYPGRSA